LTSLNIGSNNIPVENMNEIIALVEAQPMMKVLCAVPFRDKTITELDVSGQSLGVEGALVIRRYFENNRALETITFGDAQAATMKADMTEADLSSKKLGVSDAIIVAAFLPKCQ
jgi:Ran GTPase-activating protein (RanGAP) involved in mRNA processing and transport